MWNGFIFPHDKTARNSTKKTQGKLTFAEKFSNMGRIEKVEENEEQKKEVEEKKWVEPSGTFAEYLDELTASTNPAVVRQFLGSWWDLMYGAMVIFTIFVGPDTLVPYPWMNNALFLFAMLVDVIVVVDTSASVFIRTCHIRRDLLGFSSNKIQAVRSAVGNIFGMTLDMVACLPYIALMGGAQSANELNLFYKTIAVIRLTRLLSPSRMVLAKGKSSVMYNQLSMVNLFPALRF